MIIKGNDLLISLDGVAIAGSKECSIEVDSDFREVSSPSSGKFRTYKPGRKGWSVRVNSLIPDDETVCSRLLKTGNLYELSAYVRNNAEFDRVTGYAYLQHADAQGSTGGLVNGSWVFLGNGAFTMPVVLADVNNVPLETSDGDILVVPTSEIR
mgnify:CR=1 FL=1